jgi:hypothetical protein
MPQCTLTQQNNKIKLKSVIKGLGIGHPKDTSVNKYIQLYLKDKIKWGFIYTNNQLITRYICKIILHALIFEKIMRA